jgi:hypothetical protein
MYQEESYAFHPVFPAQTFDLGLNSRRTASRKKEVWITINSSPRCVLVVIGGSHRWSGCSLPLNWSDRTLLQ